jgi:drug/metabolite transporter (DMT)-like permease
MNRFRNIKGSAILCLAALIWGLAFVAQAQAADKVPPFIFNALRSFIGAAFLFCLLLIKKCKTHAPIFPKEKTKFKEMLIGGILCGLLLTISINFQQFGLSVYPEGSASEARAGFITALYVVLVPVVSMFFGKRSCIAVWLAVAVATCGIYLLSLSEGLHNIYLGDVLMLFCALTFTFHILVIDRYGEPVGGMLLSALQFLIGGVLSGVLAICFETVVWENVIAAAPQLLYMGIMSCGIAYTLQIYGQRYADPPVASLTMSLESVFAALGGWIISGNTLSPREFGGCALVFAAIVLAQLPQFFGKKKEACETVEN